MLTIKEKLTIACLFVAALVLALGLSALSGEQDKHHCDSSCRALGAQYVLVNGYGCICESQDDLSPMEEDLFSRRFVLTPQGD